MGRERGKNVLDVDYRKDAIKSAIEQQISNGRYAQNDLYGNGSAGKNISYVLADAKLEIEKRITY